MAGMAGLLLGLAACDDNTKSALAPVTLDARLSDIYSQSCMGCHTVPDSGAPQSHNIAAWAPRLKKGDDVLLDHMVNGFNGMPPLGQCFDCSAEDLTTLMHFMAAPAPSDTPSE
ncbi:MAG: cytochrome c5 family protein [Rhizobiales bacterium]|nr:cytochrome c5 family protein [Hyphomicrobiales bacterium]